jgi:hypothetical protein
MIPSHQCTCFTHAEPSWHATFADEHSPGSINILPFLKEFNLTYAKLQKEFENVPVSVIRNIFGRKKGCSGFLSMGSHARTPLDWFSVHSFT